MAKTQPTDAAAQDVAASTLPTDATVAQAPSVDASPILSVDGAAAIQQLADVLLQKAKGQVSGGIPFDPSKEVVNTGKTPADLAKEYFDYKIEQNTLKDFPHEGIVVTNDLQIFTPDIKGLNALQNHVMSFSRPGSPSSITYESFTKPTA